MEIKSIAEAGINVNANNVFKSNMVIPCIFRYKHHVNDQRNICIYY